MDQKDLDRLAQEVALLEPENDAHWNAQGFPNCNYLRERLGFNVTASTLLAAGLQVERAVKLREQQKAAGGEPPADPGPEIKDPGAPPPAAAAPRAAPATGSTWDDNTTLHRNKKATEMLVVNGQSMLTILSRMTKKSGQACLVERELKVFVKELERTLERL